MKRLFGFFAFLLLLTSCDDGDFTVKSFNFDPNAPVKTCLPESGLYYKFNGLEALMLETPPSSFINEETPQGQPRTLLINATNQVIYRTFKTNVSDSYFCSAIPPSSPAITDEWKAMPGVENESGIIEITTKANIDQTTQTITGYDHQIVFKNITFSNGKKSFSYDTYTFGNYTTAP